MEIIGSIISTTEIIGISVLTHHTTSAQMKGGIVTKESYSFLLYTKQNQLEFRSQSFMMDERTEAIHQYRRVLANFLREYAAIYRKVCDIVKHEDEVLMYICQVERQADGMDKAAEQGLREFRQKRHN